MKNVTSPPFLCVEFKTRDPIAVAYILLKA